MTEEKPKNLTTEERDALYAEIMAKEWPVCTSMDEFLKTHESMQMDAKRMTDHHPVDMAVIKRLDRFGNDPKSEEKKTSYMKKNLHMPASQPEKCKYCKDLCTFFERDLEFEEKNLGTHRILEGDKRDHFRRQVDLIYGVFKFMKKNGEM